VDTLVSISLGIGLSAACGFRVFVPLLVASILGLTEWVPMSGESTAWMATWPALITFATATVLEILGYFIPWIDNLLDTIATPSAVAAGVLVSASVMVELPPLIRWSVALIAGGGVAALVQGTTAVARAKSTIFTGGAGNAAIAAGELTGSIVTSLIAVFVPVLALVIVALGIVVLLRLNRRLKAARTTPRTYSPSGSPQG
jgi:hypothetical protein